MCDVERFSLFDKLCHRNPTEEFWKRQPQQGFIRKKRCGRREKTDESKKVLAQLENSKTRSACIVFLEPGNRAVIFKPRVEQCFVSCGPAWNLQIVNQTDTNISTHFEHLHCDQLSVCLSPVQLCNTCGKSSSLLMESIKVLMVRTLLRCSSGCFGALAFGSPSRIALWWCP